MPGSVQVAAPSGIMPQTLSINYSEDRAYLQLQSALHDGTILRAQLSTVSRKSFRLSKRLSDSQLTTLKALWDSNGPLVPLLFYNPAEPIPGQPLGSNYDASGASVQGRYTVVFRMPGWSQTSGLARIELSDLVLIEVA